MYYVYILKLQNNKYYVGYAKDLKRRFGEHKNGNVKSTKDNLPVKLVNYIAFNDKTKALRFEKYLKRGSGVAFRNKHLV